MNAITLAILAALSWNDLEDGSDLTLTQKITLGTPYYPAGTSLRLLSREPLSIPGAQLLLLKLEQPECAHPEWESDLEIITPNGNEESSAVGVQVETGCQWSIYLEQKDLLTSSFFAGH